VTHTRGNRAQHGLHEQHTQQVPSRRCSACRCPATYVAQLVGPSNCLGLCMRLTRTHLGKGVSLARWDGAPGAVSDQSTRSHTDQSPMEAQELLIRHSAAPHKDP
jgi:hypothetical protein